MLYASCNYYQNSPVSETVYYRLIIVLYLLLLGKSQDDVAGGNLLWLK